MSQLNFTGCTGVMVPGRESACLKRRRGRDCLPRDRAQRIDRTDGGKTDNDGLSTAEKQKEMERKIGNKLG